MAKYYSEVGFATFVESSPGVYIPSFTKRLYYVDIIKNVRRLQTSNNLNDNINISNDFSMIADPFATEHFHDIKYVEYLGTKWKVVNVEVQFPRLLLSVGGIYNEQSN